MTQQSKRAKRKPTEAQKAMLKQSSPGKGKPPRTRQQKMTAAEKARIEENQERRTARCIMCRGERPKGSYPIHHACTPYAKLDKQEKEERRANPTRRPYIDA